MEEKVQVDKKYGLLTFTLATIGLSAAVSIWVICQHAGYVVGSLTLAAALTLSFILNRYWVIGFQQVNNSLVQELVEYDKGKLSLVGFVACAMYVYSSILLVFNVAISLYIYVDMSGEPSRVQGGIPLLLVASAIGAPLSFIASRKTLSYVVIGSEVHVKQIGEDQKFDLSQLKRQPIVYSMGYVYIDGARRGKGAESWIEDRIAFPVSGWTEVTSGQTK